jgi:hypothetical protein
MYLKTYRSGTQFMVAVCDKDILGKTLKEGDMTVEVSEEFYKGDLVSEEQVIGALSGATTANLFGRRAIECAIKCGAVEPECVMMIDHVPHAQMFRI